MLKRIIAMAAAVGMLFGSTAAGSGGEPVRTAATEYGPIRPKEVTHGSDNSTGGMVADSGTDAESDNGNSFGGTFFASIGSLPEPEYDSTADADSAEYVIGDSGTSETAEQYSDNDEWTPEMDSVAEDPVQESEAEEPESEWTYYGNCRITHYCDCPECTGPWYGSATASGAWPSAFYTVASGEDLPFGTEVLINDQVYVVQDRGVGCGQIDIFVGDHQLAMDMGMYYIDVYVRWQE